MLLLKYMLLLNISQKISENTNSLREILQFSRLFLNPIVKKKLNCYPKCTPIISFLPRNHWKTQNKVDSPRECVVQLCHRYIVAQVARFLSSKLNKQLSPI